MYYFNEHIWSLYQHISICENKYLTYYVYKDTF